ncbi:GSCOCT00000191001.2-RA-CDS [Cotesia congregata]|uniref:Domeless_JAKSTATpathway_Cc n=1 Tax=Cotesia congregata TaxID=51543 RepID=A0A8J2HJU3_COTCN|nr:GSCOCT00000191001.2-RA-CDS [Cotesia congregata]CAG5101117.1 Domeless_JAKSTATpathway_Cc [Cotesia congregata]
MQYQPLDVNSSDLLKHGHDHSEKHPIMSHSDVEMYNKQLEMNSPSCKELSRLDRSVNDHPLNNNNTNNNDSINKHCDVNSRYLNNYKTDNINNNNCNATEQSRFFVCDKSYRRHLSTSDCVLNSDCVSAIERLKSTKQIMTNSRPISPTKDCRSSYCYNNYNYTYNNNINNNSTSDTPYNCYRRKSQFKWLLHAFILLFIGLISTSSADRCALGLDTPGRTWPTNDIILEYGQSLRILCILNQTIVDKEFPGKNASNLSFYRNDKKMEREYIRIINSTTIEMFVEKPPPSHDMYHCKLQTSESIKDDVAVCLNNVAVGFKPEEPKNFSCISHNWENLTCTWVPVDNFIKTTHTLTFMSSRKLFPCPKHEKEKKLPLNSCLWDFSTDPIYRQTLENYTFLMTVRNALGNMTRQYKFQHFANTIPAKPDNLTVVNKTTESALLYWAVPFPMQNFPPGLHHKIAYQHQWDRLKTWQIINITNGLHEDKKFYNLTGLEYANTVYDVRVFMKSAIAKGDDKWSPFSDITFRTPPRCEYRFVVCLMFILLIVNLPGRLPRTDIGSFEITENNANKVLYLYWQVIPRYLENGDNFKYQVTLTEVNGRKTHIMPNETTRSYAVFKGFDFFNYTFQVTTSNIVGTYPKSTSIHVPSQYDMPQQPLAVTKIAFDEGLYELSWKSPLLSNQIINYTIFWCENERDRPYQCTGYLDWVHVPKNTTIYNITVPSPEKVYQFAVSANTEKASSGMVWASCTVIHNKVSSKMKSVWINTIGSDVIDVGWKLDCSDRIGVVEGFVIYYCPIVSPKNSTCREPKQNTTIRADPLMMRSTVTGLKPYTTYKITIAFWTKTGEGLESEPLYNTTLESAPTAPQNVKVISITNSSLFVTWDPPSAMNGVLLYYEVHFNGNTQKVEDSTTNVLLKDLMSYKNYTITVTACTVKCSVESRPIIALTKIGVPGKINRPPIVKIQDSNFAIVIWSRPQNPGGRVDYYQVSAPGYIVINSNGTETKIPIPGCVENERDTTYRFKVRAININTDGEHLAGPWSDIGETSCWNAGISPRVYIIIWVICGIFALLVIAATFIYTKKMWRRCKLMQDCEVKLPPGLAAEKLLQKPGEQHIRQSSADSSGCSSVQESVTSSLTSNSHVSNDSGTETDPVSSLQNKLLDTTLVWESSSLRQRNVSGGTTRPGPGALTEARWDSYVKAGKPGERESIEREDTMSIARSTPNLRIEDSVCNVPPQTWSSTGYISMPSSEDVSTTNSSPVSVKASNISSYSVVGLLPTKMSPTRSKSSEDTSEEAKANIPYVSLASLDHKLTFISPISKEPLKSVESSKPYVQTGLIDNLKNPPFTQSEFGSKFVPKPVDRDSSMKYVTVASIAEMTKPAKDKLVQSTTDASQKPYVQASTMFQMLQAGSQEKKHEPMYWESGGDGDSKTVDVVEIEQSERSRTPQVSSSGDSQHILD